MTPQWKQELEHLISTLTSHDKSSKLYVLKAINNLYGFWQRNLATLTSFLNKPYCVN